MDFGGTLPDKVVDRIGGQVHALTLCPEGGKYQESDHSLQIPLSLPGVCEQQPVERDQHQGREKIEHIRPVDRLVEWKWQTKEWGQQDEESERDGKGSFAGSGDSL